MSFNCFLISAIQFSSLFICHAYPVLAQQCTQFSILCVHSYCMSISVCLHMSTAVCVGVHVCKGKHAEAAGISCKFFWSLNCWVQHELRFSLQLHDYSNSDNDCSFTALIIVITEKYIFFLQFKASVSTWHCFLNFETDAVMSLLLHVPDALRDLQMLHLY